MFGVNVRGAVSIRQFLANPRVLRAIRTFNLTHMNRGRNAYQASHCYSVADYMMGGVRGCGVLAGPADVPARRSG
jgi:hypothetical protein